METVTSSPSTVGWPHASRRRNRWLLWVGRILLGRLALIVILAASGVSYEAIMTAATRSAIHFRDSCWMSVVTACTCIASDRAARPSCSRPRIGHRPQRLPSAQLSVPHESIAFSKRGQHRDRQSFEPAFPVGPFLRSTAWASNAERRAACLTDGWLITSPSSTPALHSAVSGRRRLEQSSPTMSTCFAYPQPISRSAVRPTSSAVSRSASSGDELW
jgi:hypothetical protein